MNKTFRINYKALVLQREFKTDAEYEKIVIGKCPSTSEAFQLINDQNFQSYVRKDKNLVAIVLKIDNELVVNDANQVQLMLKNHNRALLIAFESNVDGKLIIYWRIKDVKNIILDRVQDGTKILNVPTDFIIDSFLIKCIKSDHNGETFNLNS
jgi:hypothetical protein